MPDSPINNAAGPLGGLVLLSLAIGAVVRLVKADKMNEVLGRFGIPPIPKAWLYGTCVQFRPLSMQ